MNYYKELSCDNYEEINREILKYVMSTVNIEHPDDFWNPVSAAIFVQATPLFQSWLKQQDLKIKALAITVGIHPNCCSVHTDSPPAVYQLSWPIQHTETTWNRWFRPATNCDIEINHWGGGTYKTSQLEEVARKRVDVPMLIHAGIPHDVWFEENSKFPRLGLQCQLLKEPKEL